MADRPILIPQGLNKSQHYLRVGPSQILQRFQHAREKIFDLLDGDKSQRYLSASSPRTLDASLTQPNKCLGREKTDIPALIPQGIDEGQYHFWASLTQSNQCL